MQGLETTLGRIRTGRFAAAALCGLLAAALARAVVGSTGTQYAIATLLLAVAIPGAWVLDWRRTGDKLSILTLVGIFYLLAFVAGSIYVWFNASFGVATVKRLPFGHAAQTRTEWLCLFSWLAFAAGYRLRLFGWLAIRPLKLKTSSTSAQNISMLVLYVAGWAARIVGIPRGLYFHPTQATAVAQGSSLNQVLAVLGVFPSIAVAYLGASTKRDPALRRYYWAGLLIELAFAIPSGQRVDSVTILLLALIVYYYTHDRMPVKAMIVAGVFALFFVFPVLYLYRTSNNNAGYQVSDLSGSLQTYTSGGLGNTMLFGIGSTLSRFSDIKLPAALEQFGRNAYPVSTGETVPWLFTNYVPHFIDPSKRNVIEAADSLAYTLRLTPVHNSSFAVTQVGEMYLDFGAAGAVIAIMFLGAVYREINDWLSLRGQGPAILALYAASAYQVIRSQESLLASSFGGLVRNLVVLALIIGAVNWLLEGSHRRQHG
jgi:hypothetical protein